MIEKTSYYTLNFIRHKEFIYRVVEDSNLIYWYYYACGNEETFSSNSEADALELLENLENMFLHWCRYRLVYENLIKHDETYPTYNIIYGIGIFDAAIHN